MKSRDLTIILLSCFLLSSCEWFGQSDLLEVYFGVIQNTSSINTETVFYYENEEPLDFTLETLVFIRFDFLYIPNNQNIETLPIVEFSFLDNDDYFFSPMINLNLESKVEKGRFIYELPLSKNAYVSFFFSLEVLSPSQILMTLYSDQMMEQVTSNPLNPSRISNNSETLAYEVVKTGKNLSFNQLNFA